MASHVQHDDDEDEKEHKYDDKVNIIMGNVDMHVYSTMDLRIINCA